MNYKVLLFCVWATLSFSSQCMEPVQEGLEPSDQGSYAKVCALRYEQRFDEASDLVDAIFKQPMEAADYQNNSTTLNDKVSILCFFPGYAQRPNAKNFALEFFTKHWTKFPDNNSEGLKAIAMFIRTNHRDLFTVGFSKILADPYFVKHHSSPPCIAALRALIDMHHKEEAIEYIGLVKAHNLAQGIETDEDFVELAQEADALTRSYEFDADETLTHQDIADKEAE